MEGRRKSLAVSVTSELDVRPLGPEAQKLYGAYGFVSQQVSVTGDATGGLATLTLIESSVLPRTNRLWKICAVNFSSTIVAADRAATLRISGKGMSQFDRYLIPGTLKAIVGAGATGFWHPLDGTALGYAMSRWFVPNPAEGPTTFEIQVVTTNIDTNAMSLDVYLLWDFYKPWR